MSKKVRDLTVEELQEIIERKVKEVLEDILEDFLALSSKEYLESIETARKEYQEGKVKSFEEIFGI